MEFYQYDISSPEIQSVSNDRTDNNVTIPETDQLLHETPALMQLEHEQSVRQPDHAIVIDAYDRYFIDK